MAARTNEGVGAPMITAHAALDIQPEVAAALAAAAPVVALESTIIAHGMPWPRNVETALAAEAEVRSHGAQPATIAVHGGRLKVGLTRDEIERLGQPEAKVAKASRRDLAVLMARGLDGATTVSATMAIAALAGIRVFATGGIGGVHRGAATSFDISADLQELARTPVAVVCAGPKSILDLGLTLEYLETHGVPVIGWRTDRLPAFHTPDSDFAVDVRIDEVAEIARVMQAHWTLGWHGGLVVANPIAPQFALPRAEIDIAIAQALVDAQAQGVAGKALTPFLLQALNLRTAGRSLAANIALVLANARLAASIAVAYAGLSRQGA